jgi:hypothetical protein
VCGSQRIPLTRDRLRYGACSLVSKDEHRGCPDPLRDYYREEAEDFVGPAPAPSPQPATASPPPRAEGEPTREAAHRAEVERLTRERDVGIEKLASIGPRWDALECERDAALARAESAERERDEMLHKVITCGVAASHPDPGLASRGIYAGAWDSPQAEEVRTLRRERDEARAALVHGTEDALRAMDRTALLAAEQSALAALARVEELEGALRRSLNDGCDLRLEQIRALLAKGAPSVAAPPATAPATATAPAPANEYDCAPVPGAMGDGRDEQ